MTGQPLTSGGTLTSGKLCTYDGSGIDCNSDLISNSTFENEIGVVRNTGNHTTDDFVFGSPQLDDDTNADHDARMFFDKSKKAFRAGEVSSEWDEAYIGTHSMAIGGNTTASGDYSSAMGYNTTASGDYSSAMGGGNTASGNSSMAIGYSTTASGNSSMAMGNSTTASGDYSTAIGGNTTASGRLSTTIGSYTVAESYVEAVIGSSNTIATSPNATSWVTTDRLFTVGNGLDSSNRSDAMVILKNGNVGIGISEPKSKLQVKDGDIHVETIGSGIILSSPDGTCYRVTVANGGAFSSASITCP